MKRTFLTLIASLAASGVTSAAVTFHSDFNEANLAAITGLNIDTPATTGTNSGTVALNTGTATLDFTANSADMWLTRDGAPIAWVAAPTVGVGETWFVETRIDMVNSIGAVTSTYDQAGMTFYGGPDGANPGDIDALALVLSDWSNTWNAQMATLSGGNSSNTALSASATNIYFRTEITEGGATDTYNFFFKENAGDAWTQLGGDALNAPGSFNNSRVALFLKSHNANTNASAAFDYLTVGTVPEPSTALLGLAGLSLILRRRRK